MALRAWTVVALGVVSFQACNCGRQPTVMKTEASVSLAVDELDFGVVPEGTSKGLRFRVDNVGRAPVNLTVTLAAGGSPDFSIGTAPGSVDATGFIEVPVVFTPVNPGSDEAFVEVKTDVADEPPLRLRLKGGPIVPALTFEPDPLAFAPATMSLERRTAMLKSTGTAALTVRSVGVFANGNPDFSVVPPALPVRLLPGESVGVRVEYARSARTTEGQMEVLSDDAAAGLRRLRLLPDPPSLCSNLIDDDMDGLIDFPNDPGCQDPMDNDEYNPAQCVNGATQPCGAQDGGFCAGMRSCANGVWGTCLGAGMPAMETCNSVDEDCDGLVDDGVTRPCYTFAAGTRGVGNCRDGAEACMLGQFGGACVGQVGPSAEVCGNAVDEDCSGAVDNGCDAGVPFDAGTPVDAGTSCNPVGTWRLDGGAIQYQCCNIFGLGTYAVNINVTQFNVQTATSIRPQPAHPSGNLTSTMPLVCPSGSFTASRTISGGCTEIFTLQGTFTSPNRFVGTYRAEFTGSQCVGDPQCGGEDCFDQTFPIEAYR
jgi:hypothetical protein